MFFSLSLFFLNNIFLISLITVYRDSVDSLVINAH